MKDLVDTMVYDKGQLEKDLGRITGLRGQSVPVGFYAKLVYDDGKVLIENVGSVFAIYEKRGGTNVRVDPSNLMTKSEIGTHILKLAMCADSLIDPDFYA